MKEKQEMPDLSYASGPSRYVCDTLEEMRIAIKTLNLSPLPGLIEETQILVNRMEGAIRDVSTLKNLGEDIHKLKAAKKVLVSEVEVLIERRDNG